MTNGALDGLRVIDAATLAAGPLIATWMAEQGAEVIKVEQPDGGDDARAIGPFLAGRSAYFMSVNRGKESIALDLKADGDRAVFAKLLERADVLVENYRPGTMEKLGFGWDDLKDRHPRLIYAAASGFGHSGPYMTRPAYDMVVQAMGGIMSLTGHPGAPPTRVGTSVGDITAALFTTIGVNAALYHRQITGRGMKVDVAMMDCQVAILENAISRYLATGEVPGPLGARHPSITPFAAFAARDGHIIIAAGNDSLFRKLCVALGRPHLVDDSRFASNDLRTTHQAELQAEIEAALMFDDVAPWLERIGAAGVPCAPINDVADVVADPQVAARNMIVESPDEAVGAFRMAGNPVKLSAFADPGTRPPAPALDEHREAILRELGVE